MTQAMKDILNSLFDRGVHNNSGDPAYKAKTEEMRAKGLEVYHVIEDVYNMMGEEVKMISYCFISSDDNFSTFFNDFRDGYCYANVVNPTWDIEEMGSIAFKLVKTEEHKCRMKRIG